MVADGWWRTSKNSDLLGSLIDYIGHTELNQLPTHRAQAKRQQATMSAQAEVRRADEKGRYQELHKAALEKVAARRNSSAS